MHGSSAHVVYPEHLARQLVEEAPAEVRGAMAKKSDRLFLNESLNLTRVTRVYDDLRRGQASINEQICTP